MKGLLQSGGCSICKICEPLRVRQKGLFLSQDEETRLESTWGREVNQGEEEEEEATVTGE